MLTEELKQAVSRACQKLFNVDIEPEISRTDEQFGDFATNAALQLAEKAGNPREAAEKLAAELRNIPGVKEVSVGGPGFINFKLTDEKLAQAALAAAELPKPLAGQEILVEFGDPNPFKEMHIGHLYSYIVGESICRLLESGGAAVKRLSYHGDVGLHIAKAIYGMRELEAQKSGDMDKLEDFLGTAYALGNKQYEENEQAKTEVETINKQIYDQGNQKVNELHQRGVELSFSYFDKILDLLSISNDRRYLESETSPVGLELVKQNIGRVFTQSQGAIVYEGEKAGLHTRVFITSKSLPTYETKDLGLVELKNRDFSDFKRSIVITANEQTEYFKVMLAALAELKPDLVAKTTHLAHGFLSLTTGKMSSRSGNVLAAKTLLQTVKGATGEKYPDSKVKDEVYLAAVKYSMLKHRLGQDIVIDVQESVSLEGNSGPYLQYAFARAQSILQKSKVESEKNNALDFKLLSLDSAERSLARKVSEYPEVVEKAVNELMPHHICTYLYELAQTFNSFYEKSRIIGDEREAVRLDLVKSYSAVLKSGLNILNIEAPGRM